MPRPIIVKLLKTKDKGILKHPETNDALTIEGKANLLTVDFSSKFAFFIILIISKSPFLYFLQTFIYLTFSCIKNEADGLPHIPNN